MAKRIAVNLSDPIFDEISSMVRQSYPNSCILWIDRVENTELRTQFDARKDVIAAKVGGAPEVIKGFHGTKPENIDAICRYGFDPKLNVRSAYGRGVYFAKFAKYSSNYAPAGHDEISFMFLADVLVGEKGSDVYVNNTQNPTIYVTPYADGAFPSYVIAFHSMARD